MDKRLFKMLASVKLVGGGKICMIDTYNQALHEDVSCTIRTNINTANHHFIVELCDTKENTSTPTKVSIGTQHKSSSEDNLGGGISRCVKTDDSLAVMEEVKIAAMRGRNPENPSERGKSNGKYKQRLEINENGTSNTITSVQKDNLVIEPKIIKVGNCSPSGHNASSVVDANGISPTVME